jgi:hypothetical protein
MDWATLWLTFSQTHRVTLFMSPCTFTNVHVSGKWLCSRSTKKRFFPKQSTHSLKRIVKMTKMAKVHFSKRHDR